MPALSVLPIFVPPLLSFAVTLLTLIWMLRGRLAHLALDRPNPRSLHSVAIPRSGGLALKLGILAGWFVVFSEIPLLLLAGSLLLFFVSFADDRHGLPIAWRFLAHLVAAGMLTAVLDPLSPLTTVIVLLAAVSMINIYNFMDGSDGLAGGMALLGFGFYGLAAGLAGELPFASVNLTVAAAALAFLFFNFHPARIFMGDSGSVPLGFLAAGLGITGSLRGYWPVWFSPLVFSPFIVDATVTLARRLLRGEKVWLAHREHYYQRLVRMGCGHRATALLEYALMLCVGASAVWGIFQTEIHQIALLLLWASIYAVLMTVVDLHWTRFLRRQVTDESAKV